MDEQFLSLGFVSLIPKELAKEFEKVTRVLDLYAQHLHITLEELRLVDVCDYEGHLNKKLLTFINKRPRLPKQTSKREKEYKQETISRIGRLIRDLLGIKKVKVASLFFCFRTYPHS
jgi:hypothetical protein